MELIPEERIPFPPPKKRLTRKAESPPDWETQYKFRCAEDRPEFRGKVWRKPQQKRFSLQNDQQVVKIRRRRQRKRELLEESQSIYLSKRGLTLAVKFPSRTEVLMSNQRGTRVIEKELCECKSFPKKFTKFRKSQNHLITLQSAEKFANNVVEDKIDTVMNEVSNLKLSDMESDDQEELRREFTIDLSDEETKIDGDKILDSIEKIEIVDAEECSTEEKVLEQTSGEEDENSFENNNVDYHLNEGSEDEVTIAKDVSDETESVDSEKNPELSAEGSFNEVEEKQEADSNESVSISTGSELKAVEEMVAHDNEEHNYSEDNENQEEIEIKNGNYFTEELQCSQVVQENGKSTGNETKESDYQSTNESEQLEESVEEVQMEDEKETDSEMICKPRMKITRQESIIIQDVGKHVVLEDPIMDEIFLPEEDVPDEAVHLSHYTTEQIGKEEDVGEFEQENIDDTVEKLFEDVENIISEGVQDIWPEELRENIKRESDGEYNTKKENKQMVESIAVDENKSKNEESDREDEDDDDDYNNVVTQ